MIKSALNIAVCGFVAAVISAPAFAQSPAAVSALQETTAGKNFISQVLKLKPSATTAEILAKINSLPANETAGVVGAISLFNQGMAAKAGNVAQISAAAKKNSDLAASIFSANNQPVQTAALAQKYGSTVKTDAAVVSKSAGQCSAVLDAGKLANKQSKVSFATLDAAIRAGIVQRGKCDENPEEMESPVSSENFAQMAECGLNENALSKTGTARLDVYAGCLIKSQADDNAANPVKDLATAEQAVARVGDKCNWFPVSSADLPKAKEAKAN